MVHSKSATAIDLSNGWDYSDSDQASGLDPALELTEEVIALKARRFASLRIRQDTHTGSHLGPRSHRAHEKYIDNQVPGMRIQLLKAPPVPEEFTKLRHFVGVAFTKRRRHTDTRIALSK